MTVDPFADLIHAANLDGLAPAAPTPSPSPAHAAATRPRSAGQKRGVSRQTAFNRMRYMAHEYGLTSTDLRAIYALARIEELMQLNGVTVDDLRDKPAEAAPPPAQVVEPITYRP